MTEEIESLKEALEEATEFSDFCEELTEKNLTLSDQIKDLQEQVEMFEEEKSLQEEVEESLNEELKDMRNAMDSMEVEIANFKASGGSSHERHEEDQRRLQQCIATIQSLQAQLGESATDLPDFDGAAVAAAQQEVLAQKLDLAKKTEEQMAEQMERELAVMAKEDLLQRVDCLQAMLPEEQIKDDLEALQTMCAIQHIIYKGNLGIDRIKRKMDVQLSSKSTTDIDLMARFISALVELLGQAHILAAAMDGSVETSEDVYIRLGVRHRTLSGVEDALQPLISSLKSDEVPSVDYLDTLEDLPRRLKELIAAEPALAQHMVPHWWQVRGACARLAADSITLKLLGIQLQENQSMEGCVKAGQVAVGHAEGVMRRLERMQERVTPSSRLLLPDTDAATLAAAVGAAAQASRSLAECCDGWEAGQELEDSMAANVLEVIGVTETGETQDSEESVDSLLEVVGMKLNVFVEQLVTGKFSGGEKKVDAPWKRRGDAKRALITDSASLQGRLEKAEAEARERLAALKRSEKDKADSDAKFEVLTRRLEERTADVDTLKKKIAELNEQDTMYQQAMDTLQDEIANMTKKNKQLSDQNRKLEDAKLATTLAPTSADGGGVPTAQATELLLTVAALRKANSLLQSKLVVQRADGLNVIPGIKVAKTSQPMQTLAAEVSSLQKDVGSLLACPKVVDISKKSAANKQKADPSQRFREEYNAAYKVEHRCQTLFAQLRQKFLQSQPGAAADTNFGTFPCNSTARTLQDPKHATRVGTVRLPQQQIATGVLPVYMDYNQFQSMHSALVR